MFVSLTNMLVNIYHILSHIHQVSIILTGIHNCSFTVCVASLVRILNHRVEILKIKI